MINKYITSRHAIKVKNKKMTKAGSKVDHEMNSNPMIEYTKSTTP